jgi:hypothetical protein
MPAVSFVVPNMCNDMHDCAARIGDDWLSKNLPPIIAWNAKHNGLLIVSWDEADPDTGDNRIPTILVGPMVRPGAKSEQFVDHYGVLRTIESFFGLACIGPMVRPGAKSEQFVDHYGVLRTIESFFGLACIGEECKAAPITGIWQ